MTIAEVGNGQVAIFPTLRGFRSTVDRETTASTNSAAGIFQRGFAKAGTDSGSSFAKSFGATSNGALNKSLTDAIAKASRDLSTVRLREQDATGKLRVAEAQLAEARQKYEAGSSQLIRAEERLATAQRGLDTVQDNLRASTARLSSAKRDLADATATASSSSGGLRGTMDGLLGMFRTGPTAVRNYATEVRSGLGTIFAGNFLADAAGSAFRLAGRAAAVGLAVGLGSINLAADLGETRSAVEQVFGAEASAELNTYANTANSALGQTRTSVLRASQTFGVFGRAAGLAGPDLSRFSTRLVGLSTDLASFYNADPSEVIEALGSGLRGEAEPLRRFGILLDDATLKAKALEMGIYDGTDSLTQQQKILAAGEVIFAQSSIAQGDFARTSEGLANQQRILSATLEDTQVRLGEYLLPGFTSIVSYANAELLPRLGEIADRVGPKLADALQESGPEFEKALDKLGPFVDKLTDASIDAIPGFVAAMDQIVTKAPEWAAATEFLFNPDEQPAAGLNATSEWLDGAGLALREFFTGSPAEERKQWWAELWEPGITGSQQFADASRSSFEDFNFRSRSSLQGFSGDWAGTLLTTVSEFTIKSDQIKDYWRFSLSELKRFTGEMSLQDEGYRVAQGFADGIISGSELSTLAAERMALAARDKVRNTMQIESPSKVMDQYGRFTAQGYANGIDADAWRASASLEQMLRLPERASASSSGVGERAGVYAPITIIAGVEDGRVLGRKFGREFSNQWG